MKKPSLLLPKSYKKTSKYKVYFQLCVPAGFEAQKKPIECELSYLPYRASATPCDWVLTICV